MVYHPSVVVVVVVLFGYGQSIMTGYPFHRLHPDRMPVLISAAEAQNESGKGTCCFNKWRVDCSAAFTNELEPFKSWSDKAESR